MKCHRFNLTPSEPSSLLIWTHRDVAAEHHKGAAYQHRCYLVCVFHRGMRTPPYTHTRAHTHYHWIQIKDISTEGNSTRQHNQPSHQASAICCIYTKIKMEKPGCALKYICPTCCTNCLIDVHFYRINMLFEGFLEAAFGDDKGSGGKSWHECCDKSGSMDWEILCVRFKMQSFFKRFVFPLQITDHLGIRFYVAATPLMIHKMFRCKSSPRLHD